MAWTPPRTWIAGEVVTESLLNTHLRDNLLALAPVTPATWTAWTPTVLGGATTLTEARYTQVGKTVTCQATVAFTTTVALTISVSLPVTARTGAGGGVTPVGTARAFDSGTTFYSGMAMLASTTTVVFYGPG